MRVHFNDLPLPVRERLHQVMTAHQHPLLIARGFGQVGSSMPRWIALGGCAAFVWLACEAAIAAQPWSDLFAAAAATGLVGIGFATHVALGRIWPASPFDCRDGAVIGLRALRIFDGDLHVLSLLDAERIEVVKRRRLLSLRIDCGSEAVEVSADNARAAEVSRFRALEIVARHRQASASGQDAAFLDPLWELSRGLRDDASQRLRGPLVARRPAWAWLLTGLLALALTAGVLIPLWRGAAQRASTSRSSEAR